MAQVMAAGNRIHQVICNDGGVNVQEYEQEYLNYVIVYVKFCYEPITNVMLRHAIEGEMLLRGEDNVPSPHHRFIYFRANHSGSEFDYDTAIYGILEHVKDEHGGVVCYLYLNTESDDLRAVTRRVDAAFHRNLIGYPTQPHSIRRLSINAWTGPYHLINNNCIHYAIRCWNLLQPDHRQQLNFRLYPINYRDVWHAHYANENDRPRRRRQGLCSIA